MSPFRFNKFDPDLQVDLVMNHGIKLTSTKRYNVLLHLFRFTDFYVELFCNEGNDELITIRAFDDATSLEPYLEEIDISMLAH